jgi:type IV pilus assembly protein PilM
VPRTRPRSWWQPSPRSVEARNNEHLAQIEEARKQVAALQGLVATKANWLDFLSDVQTRLAKVGDVWLERVQIVQPLSVDASAPVAEGAVAAPAAPPLKLAITGRLLDVANPVSNVSPESYERVKKLIASFTGSPFVSSVENERFDNTQPGLLRFDFTLVVNAARPL